MADYSYIQTAFWNDPENEKLTPEEKLVFIYSFSNPQRTQSGIYAVSDRRIAFDTGYPIETISKVLDSLCEKGKIQYDGKVIWVVNFLKHQPNSSPTVKTRIAKDLRPYMNHSFIEEFKEKYKNLSIPYSDPIDTFPIKGKGKENEKEEEREIEKGKKDKNILKNIMHIVLYLNEKTGKNFHANNKATTKFIKARLEEGRTVEQMKKVIDHKCKEWLNDPKMKKFLRPETLFNATKFESYINEVPKKEEKGEYDGIGTKY